MYIDTHAHIYLEQFKADLGDTISRSMQAGVTKIFMPNIDHTSVEDMLDLESKYDGICYPMMGLHPCSVNKGFQKQLQKIENWINQREFAGIGEIGTDLYWEKKFWPQQQEAIQIQLRWAIEKGWPAIIHCRDSISETIDIVEQISDNRLYGIFHCFTGTLEQARRITNMGFSLGIGGVSTFKNGGLEEVIKGIDLKKIVLETDSPYLAPVPHRGKRNEPSYIPLIAGKIAEVLKIPIEKVALITTENSKKIFQHAI